uniref:Uncharacterized protein n=1 Tax=Vespula pensylvanica TaxID=30213 RepID=A0A834N6Z2_VESPE|nr:hypothetical protein H0235_016023 [Vespula pensylvanica]
MFVTTIDVTLRDYHRFEIPSVPRFFDLRNPRVLKDEVGVPRESNRTARARSLKGTIDLRQSSSYRSTRRNGEREAAGSGGGNGRGGEAMTPFAWLAIAKPVGGSRRKRNMKNREKRKNVTSSAKRIARWLETAEILARKSHGDGSESKSGEGCDGREYKSKYFQCIDEYSNGRDSRVLSTYRDCSVPRSSDEREITHVYQCRGYCPVTAVRLQRVTGVMGHCPRLVEERWPRGEHGDVVSRIIANVDTTSDVVFPVDKVAFGRRG